MTTKQHLDGPTTKAREQLPAAEEEIASSSAAFEIARYIRDQDVKRYRKLRDAVDRDEHEGAV